MHMALNIERLCGECSTCGRKEKRTQTVTGNLKERGHLEELGVDWKTAFKWELQMQRLNSFDSEKGPIIGICGHCN